VFTLAEELKGVLKERYQQEYDHFLAEQTKKVRSITKSNLIANMYLCLYRSKNEKVYD